MQNENFSAKIKVKDGWVMCPRCKTARTTLRLDPDSAVENVPVYCRRCRSVYRVSVKNNSQSA